VVPAGDKAKSYRGNFQQPTPSRSKPSTAPQVRALRQQAEQKLRTQSPPDPPKGEAEIRALVHELQVHQIELEMQNEELLRVQAEVQRAADKYTALFDFSPVACFVIDAQGCIREVNVAGAALLGLSRQRVNRQRFERFVAPECRQKFNVFWRGVESGPARGSCELWLLRPGHGRCAAVVEACPVEGVGGPDERCWLTVSDITERRELERQLLTVSELEQARIGQDLHDGLSQQITGIVLLNSSLREDLVSKALPEAAAAGRIGELLVLTQRDLRLVARGLQPVADVPEGLGIALAQLAQSVSGRGGLACRFRCGDQVLIPDQNTASHLFRIAQEAVNNAVRHGHPKHISLALMEAEGALVLQVQDDGRGWGSAHQKKAGLGLRIMQSRSEALGGKLEIRPITPHGILVRCIVPQPVPTAQREGS